MMASKSATRDPICGMTVDEATAIHSDRDGKTFCVDEVLSIDRPAVDPQHLFVALVHGVDERRPGLDIGHRLERGVSRLLLRRNVHGEGQEGGNEQATQTTGAAH